MGGGCIPDHKDAYKIVRGLIEAANPLPLPQPTKKFVCFALRFRDGKWIASVGPLVTDSTKEAAQFSQDLKKPTYESKMEEAILKFDLNSYPETRTPVKVIANLKLAQDGKIAGIAISAPDQATQKFVYELLSKSHPFAIIPEEYVKSPNFRVKLEWVHADGKGKNRVEVTHSEG